MHSTKTILAVGARPGDLELGCGATLAKLIARGAHVTAVIFSDGGLGAESGSDRVRETREALGFLGVQAVVQHAFFRACPLDRPDQLLA